MACRLHVVYAHVVYAHVVYAHVVYAHVVYAHVVYAHVVYAYAGKFYLKNRKRLLGSPGIERIRILKWILKRCCSDCVKRYCLAQDSD